MSLNPYDWYKQALEHKFWRWVVIIITTIYFFSPIDLIPGDFITFFGLIDDGVLLTLLVTGLLSVTRQKRIERQQAQSEKSDSQTQGETIDVEVNDSRK